MAISLRRRIVLRDIAVSLTALVLVGFLSITFFGKALDDANKADYQERLRTIIHEYELLDADGEQGETDAVSGASTESVDVDRILLTLQNRYGQAIRKPYIVDSKGSVKLEYPDAGIDRFGVLDALIGVKEGDVLLRGSDGLASRAYVTYYESWDWYTFFAVPEEERLLSLYAFRNMVFISYTLVIVGLIVIQLIGLGMDFAPLSRLMAMLRRFDGDSWNLTSDFKLEGASELRGLSASFNAFISRLRTLIGNVRQTDHDLADTGTRLASSVHEVRAALETVHTKLELLRAIVVDQQERSIAEASSTVRAAAAETNALAQEIGVQARVAREASERVSGMSETMAAADAAVSSIGKAISDLVVSARRGRETLADVDKDVSKVAAMSDRLAEASRVIADLASRTNLLAMNAAIEAAHAGASGKGFAVVAGEIRNLAESSTEESRRIDRDLSAIRESVQRVVEQTAVAGTAFDTVQTVVDRAELDARRASDAVGAQAESALSVIDSLSSIQAQTERLSRTATELGGRSDKAAAQVESLSDESTRVVSAVEETLAESARIAEGANEASRVAEENKGITEKALHELKQFEV